MHDKTLLQLSDKASHSLPKLSTAILITEEQVENIAFALCNRMPADYEGKQLIGILTENVTQNNLEAIKSWIRQLANSIDGQNLILLNRLDLLEQLVRNDIETFWLSRDFILGA